MGGGASKTKACETSRPSEHHATRLDKHAEVVSEADGYIGGIKVWGIGMQEDPNPGSKRGKGVQHMNSDFWVSDMGVFINAHLPTLQSVLTRVRDLPQGSQYVYLLNQCNMTFCRSLKAGLRTATAVEQWLMASWLCMAAAELDSFPYGKYTSENRAAKQMRFFTTYLEDNFVAPTNVLAPSEPHLQAPISRIDLLPAVALERLSLHNELCQVKYGDEANAWMKEGFKLTKRVDSVKRHIDEAYHHERHEDAIAHLIWNFMAIYHVLVVFPSKNDLPDFEALARSSLCEGES